MIIQDLLKGRVALVTGGTRGIGLAIVKKFLEQGAYVILCGSSQASADRAVAKLTTDHPELVRPLESDRADSAQSPEPHDSSTQKSLPRLIGLAPKLASVGSMQEICTKIAQDYGHLDILVNNAGISARESIYEYAEADFDAILELNIKAIFAGIKAAAPIMKKQGSGAIINTSSMVSLYGQARGCGYPASKFAVNGLTKSLARELGPDQIRVNAVAPGVTKTDMVAALPPEILARVSADIPLGRVADPDEIANVFLFLASDLATYVTGAVYSVDGASQG